GDNSLFEVHDVRRAGEYVLHIGRHVKGTLSVGEHVQMILHRSRRDAIRSNHTATHLLNHALREVLTDEEIEQRGSLVADDRLRFDFSCGRGLTPEEIEQVESAVNHVIGADDTVYAELVPLEKAQQINGVRAVFGERYPDPVRVVSIGVPVHDLLATPASPRWMKHSIEFCGGTHLASCGESKHFVITQETALAAGVRRIMGLTGAAAIAAETAGRNLLARVNDARSMTGDDLIETVEEVAQLVDEIPISLTIRNHVREALEPLRETVKALKKQANAASRDAVVEQARDLAAGHAGPVLVARVDGADRDSLMNAMDVLRAKHPEAASMLFTADEDDGKVTIVAAVPKALIGKGLKAGDWVKLAAGVCGGGGGGRPDM
ncbi:MAG: hypothetical protein KC983_11760, partial [Phycisphaerales bacterium]|nr:hypothetical protein [Phycisphaerales bacterium]